MTNFTFIKDTLPEVYELGFKTEEHLKQDKRACAFYCRLTLEVAVNNFVPRVKST
ncbi:hypothetical protein PQO03_06725 [Lentisphaera profundi]|uniref:Uncharacterized protein n=1 Tax=Lentisphaera profundi TaxID=1658616 RepID=A0ABY7VQ89_9BACT|nr:hypothetical protein [Lentisphaera profundi]WDE95410.1 hypothetical protein PQO03_06725 [Lentisphaera profundi]